MELSGRVGIITGASRGLGVYFAEALAARGMHLALAARSDDELKEVANRVSGHGVKVAAIPTDVGKLNDLQTLVETTEDELGFPDLLVNNAGIEKYSEFHRYEIDVIEKILRVNLWSTEVLTRLVLPGMIQRRRGHIANIASIAGKTAVPYNTIYSSSKHGLVGFSWSLREEVKPYGIGVSVICPGFVSDSGMYADWSGNATPPGLTRTVSPDEVARALISAVERDKAETLVAKGIMRIVDVFHALSPELTTAIARRTGAYEFLRRATNSSFRE